MDPLAVLAYGAEQALPLIGIGIGQWCFAILAEWPLVIVAVMSANKCSKGIVDSPLYILKTSSRSAQVRRSSNVHRPRCSSLLIKQIFKSLNHSCKSMLNTLK